MTTTANFLRRTFLLLSASFFLSTSNDLLAQTTWTGSLGTDWNTGGNWSAGVPDEADDVTIPDVTNDPVISIAGSVAKSVTVQAGGLLSINAAGTLTINGAVADGFLNQGTVQNNGTINIGNTSAVGTDGLQNAGTFNNNSGANININGVEVTYSYAHLYNNYGTFTNAGTITTGAISAGGIGLENFHGNFNNAGGVINVSSTLIGVDLVYGGITNSGIINIGPAGSSTIADGLICSYGTFSNSTGGQININRVTTAISIYNVTISNAGTFAVGTETAVGKIYSTDLVATGPFNNNSGGIFKGTGTVKSAYFVNAGGTLAPGNPLGKLTFNGSEDFTNSIMSMDINGTGTAGVNYDQVAVSGTATLGGTLALSVNYAGVAGDQVTILSATAVVGAFSSVTGLPANWYVIYTPVSVILSYQPVPGNTWTGNVNTDWNNAGNWSTGIPLATDEVIIPNVTNDPTISTNTAVAKSVRVQSGGILTISASGTLTVNGGSIYGVWNKGGLSNWGTLRIGNTSSTGSYGLYNENTVQNFSGCVLDIDHVSTAGIALISGIMNNAGTVTIGSLAPVTNLVTGETGTFNSNGGSVNGTGNLSAANFTNAGGTLSPGYSPGIMTFNGDETFTNSKLAIEINGPGAAGVTFDQVVVSGVATLGGTLNLSLNFAGGLGDQYTILVASSVSGTFSTVNGLPAGWNVVYYPTSVVVSYGLAASTWTGAVSTAWNTAGNWSAGIPNEATDVTIPDVTNDPVISVSGISIKSITVQSGGLLTLGAAGVLNINGAAGNGFLNQGTVQNNGTINIGNTSAVGTDGLQNVGTFNNNSGANININGVKVAYSYAHLYNNYGTFTNAGTITTGAISAGGIGLQNFHGNFNNAGGVINVSNTLIAVDLVYGGITNSGIINIGPAGSSKINDGLICSYGTFSNSTGGQININRVTTAISIYNVTISNAGTFAVGAETAVSNLFEMYPSASGPFSNNTGGIFKGTGTVKAAYFVNAGGTLAPGTPLGKLTFNASEDFSNSIMSTDVNGTGTPGTNYDQVVVNGTATLGGTLALSINYAGAQGDQVTLVSAGAISGTFSTITGLLPNWQVTYTPTSVLLTYDLNITWTGAVGTDWNTPGNWSTGILPTNANNVIIPDVVNDPVINNKTGGAKSVHVQPGASLTINPAGSLTIHGFSTFNGIQAGLYNQGTVHNSGALTINKP